MFPTSITSNGRYGWLTYTKHIHTFFCIHIPKFNFSYLNFCKYMVSILTSFKKCLTTFFVSISHIILISTKKQMSRINTRRIITFMEGPHSWWYWSIMKFPRYSMCFITFITTLHLPIKPSITIFSCCPNPTRTKFWSNCWSVFVDFVPKSFFNGFGPSTWIAKCISFGCPIKFISASIKQFLVTSWAVPFEWGNTLHTNNYTTTPMMVN